jgi:hypothetical protein
VIVLRWRSAYSAAIGAAFSTNGFSRGGARQPPKNHASQPQCIGQHILLWITRHTAPGALLLQKAINLDSAASGEIAPPLDRHRYDKAHRK